MLNHDRMVNVRSAADIRPALKDGKVACIHTIENATFFAEDPALIEVLKSLGVLMSSLSWNAQGPLASATTPTPASPPPASRHLRRWSTPA